MTFLLRLTYVVALMLSLNSYVFANNLCKSSFDLSSSEDSDSTSSFLAYLAILLEEGILNLEDLSKLKQSLENNSWINPIEFYKSEINSANLIHYEEFENYIHGSTLNSNRIVHWIENFLAKNHLQEGFVQKSFISTKPDIYDSIIFHPIYLPIVFYPVQIAENQYLEIMSTLVTQHHWNTVMNNNPSYFNSGNTTEVIVTKTGRKVTLQANHPVESITKYSAMVFADELSILRNLPPFYGIVNSVSFKGNPFSKARNGELEVWDFEIVNKDYNNYRLPTKTEQQAFQQLFFNYEFEFPDKFKPWVWSNENSNNQTQEVASLRPYIHDGFPFYDVYGNVIELYADFILDSVEEDLLYISADALSFKNTGRPLRIWVNSHRNDLGFRLVRTISKEEYEKKRK